MLKNSGETSESIAAVLQEITNASSAKLYFEMMSALTEEDLALLDKCETKEEAEPLLRSLYTQRTDSSPEVLLKGFLDKLATEFETKYKADAAAALAQPVETSVAPVTPAPTQIAVPPTPEPTPASPITPDIPSA